MREMIVTYVRHRLEDITEALITYDAKLQHAPNSVVDKGGILISNDCFLLPYLYHDLNYMTYL